MFDKEQLQTLIMGNYAKVTNAKNETLDEMAIESDRASFMKFLSAIEAQGYQLIKISVDCTSDYLRTFMTYVSVDALDDLWRLTDSEDPSSLPLDPFQALLTEFLAQEDRKSSDAMHIATFDV